MSRSTKLVLLTLALTGCAEDALDPELQAIVDEVLVPAGLDPSAVAVYQYEHELLPGDVIEPALVEDDEEPVAIEVESPSTLYLVDEHPWALFGHPAKYVIVDSETGDVTVHDDDIWPLVNGEGFSPFERSPVIGHAREIESGAPVELPDFEPRDGSADPCEKKNYVVTIDGAGRSVHTDIAEEVMRQVFEAKGYEVIRVPYQGSGTKTRDAIFAALAKLDALPDDSIDELVIYYAGHGLRTGMSLGHANPVLVDWVELGKHMKGIDADDRTIILESCHSGFLADHAELLMQDAPGVDEERVRVLTAAGADEYAAVGRVLASGFFSQALMEQMMATPADEPWDFDDPSLFEVAPIESVLHGKKNVQTPQSTVVEPDKPRLLPYEHGGRCDVVGHLDSQHYDRQVRFEGKWLRDAQGYVELQDENGTWHRLSTLYWGKNNVMAPIPMRSDGFPYNGKSKDAPEDVPAGHYLARVVSGDGSKSADEERYLVKVELQVYESTWTPDYTKYEYPAWQETWHPYTKGDFTKGPTIQESYIRIPSDNAPDLSKVDHDTHAEHWESEYLEWDTLGDWSYQLPPGERDLSTAYEQSYPEVNYFGFRAGFSEDYFDTQSWVYLLAYD